MLTIYLLFKFLHVLAAIVWIGGVFALTFLNARLARTQDRAAMMSLAQQGGFYGRAILSPAAGVTLIAGIVMVASTGLGGPFWILWGFGAIFGSILLGALFMRRTQVRMGRLAPTVEPGDPRMQALRRRLGVLSVLNLILLLSAVWAMVFKPTF